MEDLTSVFEELKKTEILEIHKVDSIVVRFHSTDFESGDSIIGRIIYVIKRQIDQVYRRMVFKNYVPVRVNKIIESENYRYIKKISYNNMEIYIEIIQDDSYMIATKVYTFGTENLKDINFKDLYE